MVQGLIGRKLGMTQVNDEKGRLIPVTVLRAGPCVVVRKRERQRRSRSHHSFAISVTREPRNGNQDRRLPPPPAGSTCASVPVRTLLMGTDPGRYKVNVETIHGPLMTRTVSRAPRCRTPSRRRSS